MHKVNNESSFKKPLYLKDPFGNWIEMEIEQKWNLNKIKTGCCIKLKMEVHSINVYLNYLFGN